MVVLDTSAMLYWALDSIQLSKKVAGEIVQAERTTMALAVRLDYALITLDRIIAEFYPKTVW